VLDLRGIEHRIIRPAGAYRPSSRDVRKQLFGLVEHLFVIYSVPSFLIPCCFRCEVPFAETYRNWLVAIAQGDSFPKLVHKHMTSREAHFFLCAPADHHIYQNVWWARLKAAGIPDEVSNRLLRRLFARYSLSDSRDVLREAIRFFARFYNQMNLDTIDEVADCLAWKIENESGVSLRGRTVASMIKVTQDWHLQMRSANVRELVEWPGLQIQPWHFEQGGFRWEMTELRNNIDLLREGRKQHHCVFAYVPQCIGGKSAIFSLRRLDEGESEHTRVLTVEVNEKRQITQIRGQYNRRATDAEQKLIRIWARDKALRIAS
jgi:hypothetical protein